MLTLPIKRKWFDMIDKGIKREEYREIKPYYAKRFLKLAPSFTVRFRAGYSNTSPLLECNVVLSRGLGIIEWGAPEKEQVYILSIIKHERIV